MAVELNDLVIKRPCRGILLNNDVLEKVQIINGMEKGKINKSLTGKPVGTIIYKQDQFTARPSRACGWEKPETILE